MRIPLSVVLVGLVLAGCAEADPSIGEGAVAPTSGPATASSLLSAATSSEPPTSSTTTTTTSSMTTTTTTTTTTSTTTTTMAPAPNPAECVAALPVALRVGQVIVPVVDAKHLDTVSDLVGRGLVGGLVVVGSPDAGIVSDLADLQALAAVAPLMVAVDEEGGTVQRMADLLGTLPSARRLVDLPTGAVWSLVAGRAAALADLGFTVDLAPVLDVGGGPGIGSRSFSNDPEIVADYGNAFAGGLLAGGLTPVAKHFPGHGRADADSHDVLPVTPPLDDLRNLDLVPWRALPEGTAVMVGHLNVPGLTGGLPASLSAAAITDLLRAELGFDGPVITDDLSMGAVAEVTDVARAAVQSLGAGADLLMVGSIEEVVPSAWALIAALDEGIVGMDRLNEAVGRGFVLRGVDPCGL